MINSDNLEFLVGNKNFSKKPTQPYNKNICQFISDLSKNLINNLEAKKYPDILTFAFWCREKNILKFKNSVVIRPSLVVGPNDKFTNKFAFLSQFSPETASHIFF